jgi:hypothetical protein
MEPTLKISPRLVKPFFRQPYVVYDIVECGQRWYDPSYGNGGGDYRDYEQKLITLKSIDEAQALLGKLTIKE